MADFNAYIKKCAAARGLAAIAVPSASGDIYMITDPGMNGALSFLRTVYKENPFGIRNALDDALKENEIGMEAFLSPIPIMNVHPSCMENGYDMEVNYDWYIGTANKIRGCVQSASCWAVEMLCRLNEDICCTRQELFLLETAADKTEALADIYRMKRSFSLPFTKKWMKWAEASCQLKRSRNRDMIARREHLKLIEASAEQKADISNMQELLESLFDADEAVSASPAAANEAMGLFAELRDSSAFQAGKGSRISFIPMTTRREGVM